jgi:hypothetical protein
MDPKYLKQVAPHIERQRAEIGCDGKEFFEINGQDSANITGHTGIIVVCECELLTD